MMHAFIASYAYGPVGETFQWVVVAGDRIIARTLCVAYLRDIADPSMADEPIDVNAIDIIDTPMVIDAWADGGPSRNDATHTLVCVDAEWVHPF